MMKVLTILGTRPEIIRLSRIMPKLDQLVDHKILHTGQNYDPLLNDIFFKELNLRTPDIVIENKNATFANQLSNTFVGVEKTLNEFKPNAVLILGDTNSGLSAFICERMGYPVYHMEAGNRCYDPKVPEEKNRKVIDSVSTINLPYTNLSRENLLREGLSNNKIFVTGNPIKEVINFYQHKVDESNILERLDLDSKKYIIATAHRAENVDNDVRLKNIFSAFDKISSEYKIIFSCHPRTRQKLETFNIDTKNSNIILSEPFGFFDFIRLEQNAVMGITDSGTVQEEMCLFKIPTITIRDTTERPETVWCGSNIVSGLNTDQILLCYKKMKNNLPDWKIPQGYDEDTVSDTVINIILSNREII